MSSFGMTVKHRYIPLVASEKISESKEGYTVELVEPFCDFPYRYFTDCIKSVGLGMICSYSFSGSVQFSLEPITSPSVFVGTHVSLKK